MTGNLAFVSQSGAICSSIHDYAIREKIGFSHFISIGSMLDVDFGDMINYLGDDPNVGSIVLYVENLTNTRKFMSAARAVSRIKPIVVLKSGKYAAGARAAASHTGAMAGEDAVYDAAFKRAGIVRVDTIGDLFDCAELLSKQPIPKKPGLGIITNAGGPGVMATDFLASRGLEPVNLSADTMEKLNEFLPSFWSHGNPIDMLGDAKPARFKKTIEVCLEDPEIKGLITIFVPQAVIMADEMAKALVETLEGRSFPIFTVWMGGDGVEGGRRICNEAGIPTYETPESAVAAFMYMYSYARNLEALQEVPPSLPNNLEYNQTKATQIIETSLNEGYSLLTEFESKTLLESYGIPVNTTRLATSQEEAVQLAQEIGYPVVMKIHSKDIIHKSDVNGVQLNLVDEDAVKRAYEAIMTGAFEYNPRAEVSGVSIQSMLIHSGIELILGSKKDADFGPVILFGMGGVMTNILSDKAIALPPLNRLLARRLMENTKVFKMLQGYRHYPPFNIMLLEEILIRLSQLVIDYPEIIELDINPLVLTESEAWAVDARVILADSEVASPHHLVISPYPSEFETVAEIKEGRKISVRPIKPEDAPLLIDLSSNLSPRTIYMRFFSPMKSLSRDMLMRLTQVDYDRDIVLVAFNKEQSKEKLIGVCRLMGNSDLNKAEMAILTVDAWQGRGVGALLLERCINIAQKRGFQSIDGVVLPENTEMLGLARKLGFTIQRIPGETQYKISIALGDREAVKVA
ncbi:MAG: bifunctional acetate--CoA ligase family protein/GNAT family N-acetyltransferase [Deltaproteobacteria bacterium]|nr:bifunctional acetate--CoA ligase family protein/GNAT family N-acetyltransferase [Deltaproteobacteria bacterium]